MMGQDNDRMPDGYSKIYVCTNDNCKAVYEEWSDFKMKRTPQKDRWFNPTTNDFEK
jgi:hypothetical protein